ncbi:MAG: alkaline phosphatase family protein [Planctomycetes bacterium]|nr:alkaline phosphatase family protein [Planctomycetota bacterium]
MFEATRSSCGRAITSTLASCTLLALLAPFAPFAPVAPAAPAAPGAAANAPLASGTSPTDGGRVIVLGFDGADARTIRELMARGELPNLKRLADQGTFAPLSSVVPAESPTAWASLNTGQNPGKTGVAGFLKRSFSGKSGLPAPKGGYLEGPEPKPITELASTPIPTWPRERLALALGGAALIVGFVLAKLVLRARVVLALCVGLVLGGGGAWLGWVARGWLPTTVPVMTTPLETTPFWETAAEAGVPCVVLDAAESFDRPFTEHAKVLFGLGYPDARGEINGFTVYTTDERCFARPPESTMSETGSGGHKFKVDERDGVILAQVLGPPNWFEVDRLAQRAIALDAVLADPEAAAPLKVAARTELDRLRGSGEAGELARVQGERTTLPLRIEKANGKARVTIGDETHELVEGEWSDWYHVTFEFTPIFAVHALTRAKLLHLDQPYFELYVDTLQFDPAKPPFWQPLSQPEDFAAELAHACGPYESVGWACMTNPLKDKLLDVRSFMQDIEFTETWREKLTFDRLARDDWRVFMSCLSTPDRVQHMLYQHYDPTHPLHDPARAAETFVYFGETITFADAIPASYRHLDATVGRVLDEFVGPDDTLIVCGDHGFQSFRREVDLNNWLHAEGYLALNPLGGKGAAKSIKEPYIDWSRTKAYALGLGGIYVNLKGREGRGIVAPEEKDELLAEILAKFLTATDPATGERFGKSGHTREANYSGEFTNRLPDLALCFAGGWRIAWDATTGGLGVVETADGKFAPGPICTDNTKDWSGDHVSVDPSEVQCVFFSNRAFELPLGGVSVLHIAPTVLSLVGVAVPPEYDGAALAPRR